MTATAQVCQSIVVHTTWPTVQRKCSATGCVSVQEAADVAAVMTLTLFCRLLATHTHLQAVHIIP